MKPGPHLAGTALTLPQYQQAHYLNRNNWRDAWCGRPLDQPNLKRYTKKGICNECKRKDGAWQLRTVYARAAQTKNRLYTISSDGGWPVKNTLPNISADPIPELHGRLDMM